MNLNLQRSDGTLEPRGGPPLREPELRDGATELQSIRFERLARVRTRRQRVG